MDDRDEIIVEQARAIMKQRKLIQLQSDQIADLKRVIRLLKRKREVEQYNLLRCAYHPSAN